MSVEAWADSRTPALAIVARGDQIAEKGPSSFEVRSQSHPDRLYVVTVSRNRWTCTCDFHRESGGVACIHLLAAKFRVGFAQSAKAASPAVPMCEACHSSDVMLWGKRANRSGVVRRFRCRACDATFSGVEGFRRRRADPDMIAKALDLYFRGTSLRQVAEHFRQAYNLSISAMMVYRWVTHFGRVAAEWMDAQKVTVGERWHVDETVVSIDGERRYVWNVLDSETRYLLATHVSRDRDMRDTRTPLHKAKIASGGALPTEVFTDGMAAYPNAVKRELGRPAVRGEPRPTKKAHTGNWYSPHKRVPSIRAPESNNLVERIHGTEKDRIRPMRGFDTMDGTAALIEGWRVHYNLARTHLTLDSTPGVAAGLPELPTFRWRAILELAAANRSVTPLGGEADQPIM